MMTNQAFIDAINENKGRHFVESVKDKNGVMLYAAVEQPEEGNRVAPVVYTSRYLDRIENGEDIIDVIESFVTFYDNNKISATYDVEKYINKDYILAHCYCKALSERCSMEPLFKVLDLNMFPYFEVPIGPGKGTIQLTNEMLNNFSISKDEIMAAMEKNMTNNLYFSGMFNMFKEMGAVIPEDLEVESTNDIEMHVLTNKDRTLGAGYIGFPEILKKCGEEMGTEQFVILPSSVHELLILPIEWISGDDLYQMVKEVNESENVGAEEFLSNNVYIFKDGEVSIYNK